MDFNDIKKKAKKLGVKSVAVKKDVLIRSIQKAEGNIECFGIGKTSCDQLKCCWRIDCLS